MPTSALSRKRSLLLCLVVVLLSRGAQALQLPTTRRQWLATTLVVATSPAHAAETVGKDPDCNDSTCLGVWDGLLADCPHLKGSSSCVSSQDDTPGVFAEPWDYSESTMDDWQTQQERLIRVLVDQQGARLLVQEGRYLRVVLGADQAIGEFYFTPNDTTVQFRIAASSSNNNNWSRRSNNLQERAEHVRQSLSFDKLPVLRNRKRSLFFVESEWDTFGPGSAALEAEMRTGEGRQDLDPKLKIDAVQGFPFF